VDDISTTIAGGEMELIEGETRSTTRVGKAGNIYPALRMGDKEGVMGVGIVQRAEAHEINKRLVTNTQYM